ncbi:hypothetical protein NM688_g6573 [Phlebia brevispora]|uniref:Uncharacterized protein n=1 Tax=Phlebia brevispora TaxID=194682 RepID=A0ACC1SEK6_9APHY|nr:hypothetical protein NM688_g6573 [Phlebia brevispora]
MFPTATVRAIVAETYSQTSTSSFTAGVGSRKAAYRLQHTFHDYRLEEGEILQYVSCKRDLCNLSISSRALQAEAEYFIYQSIESSRRPLTEYLCDLITSSPRLHTLVRSLTLSNDGEHTNASQSREYWERVALLLRDLPNLEELKIHDNMVNGNTNAWVLSQCTFSLQKFDCDFAFDDSFLSFLQGQRNLQRLYWTESYSDDNSARALEEIDVLDASVTPPIFELMTNSPRFALKFMPAATLTHVWICGPCGYEGDGWIRYMDEFVQCAKSLRSLRMNFPYGRRTLVTVLSTLAEHAPDLRSLGFVPHFDKQQTDVIAALSRFKRLESLAMWTVISADTSREVAKACPSLRMVACLHYSYSHEYVILPVNPVGTPKAHHDPDYRLWKDGFVTPWNMTTAQSNRSEAEEKTRALQHEIDKYAELIVDLKTDMNSLNLVASLQEDCLSRILHFLMLSCMQRADPKILVATCACCAPRQPVPPHPTSNYTWLHATHVCRHWYSVALHSPDLWTNIYLPSNPQFASLLLERAGYVPLTLSFDCRHEGYYDEGDDGATRNTETLKSILTQMDRIRDLDLHIEPWRYAEIQDLLTQPSERLRKPFPASPGLKELSLISIDREGEPWPLSSLLCILAPMSCLETLRLGQTAYAVDSSEGLTVILPRLEHLELNQLETAFCIALLNQLAIPVHTVLSIQLQQVPSLDTETDPTLLFHSVASKLTFSDFVSDCLPSPILTFHITIQSRTIQLTAFASLVSAYDQLLPDETRRLVLEIPPSSLAGLDLAEMVGILPLQSVRVLWLSVMEEGLRENSPTPLLAELSSSMPNVDEIHCGGVSYERCLLSTAYPTVPQMPWSNVTRLYLGSEPVDPNGFEMGYSECICSGDSQRGCRCMRRFRDVLLHRQANGCSRLASLTFLPNWCRKYTRTYIETLFSECADEVRAPLKEEWAQD